MGAPGSNPPASLRKKCRSAVGRFAPCLIAIICVGVAVLLRWSLDHILEGRFALLLLMLAVVTSAYLAGAWAALTATILSTLVGVAYFIDPRPGVFPLARPDLIGAVVFVIAGVMIALVSSRMSVLQRRAAHAAEERAREIGRMAGKLELADRMSLIGTLAAGLAHDIGNVLLPMRARLDLVETELKKHHLSSEDIESLRGLSDYLAKLSRGLGQLVADPGMLTDHLTALHEWAATLEPVLRTALPRRIVVQSHVPPDLPPVKIAPQALSQAVFNIVHNSGKAIGNRPGRIDVNGEFDEERKVVRLRIRDNGPGMPADVLRRISEVKPAVEGERGVSGVGLAVVHSIMRAVGGSVRVSSAQGSGTEVCLELPAPTPAPRSEPIPTPGEEPKPVKTA